jgi:hypothetical protein
MIENTAIQRGAILHAIRETMRPIHPAFFAWMFLAVLIGEIAGTPQDLDAACMLFPLKGSC